MNIQNHCSTMNEWTNEQKDILYVLKRLCKQDAFMVMSADLPKAVIMCGRGKSQVRSAVLKRKIGQKLLAEGWVEYTSGRKFSKYTITQAGRNVMRRMSKNTAKSCNNKGFAEAVDPFQDQHREWGIRSVFSVKTGKTEALRVNLRESPITMLNRKKDKDGKPFLGTDLLQAGERLREDFELAQLGPRVAQNWNRFLTGVNRGNFSNHDNVGSPQAQLRLRNALTALGPGLSDIALRCCCFLEGLEAAEKRMGWSARSGKIVLRIALERLHSHYKEVYGGLSGQIG